MAGVVRTIPNAHNQCQRRNDATFFGSPLPNTFSKFISLVLFRFLAFLSTDVSIIRKQRRHPRQVQGLRLAYLKYICRCVPVGKTCATSSILAITDRQKKKGTNIVFPAFVTRFRYTFYSCRSIFADVAINTVTNYVEFLRKKKKKWKMATSKY